MAEDKRKALANFVRSRPDNWSFEKLLKVYRDLRDEGRILESMYHVLCQRVLSMKREARDEYIIERLTSSDQLDELVRTMRRDQTSDHEYQRDLFRRR